MRGRPVLFLLPALVVIAVLLAAPLGLIVGTSFNEESAPGAMPSRFTTEHFVDLVHDGFYPRVLMRTVLLAGCTTVLAVVFGYVLALRLWVSGARARLYLGMVVVAPLLVSVVARTYGWLLVLGEKGWVNSVLLQTGLVSGPVKFLYTDGAVVLGLVHLLIAFPALSIHASLERVPGEMLEAAVVAGAGPWMVFRRVLLPLTMPGVLVGATLVFSLAMSAYVTPALMGGNSSALATLVFQKFMVALDWNRGAALAVVLLASSVCGVALIGVGLGTPRRMA